MRQKLYEQLYALFGNINKESLTGLETQFKSIKTPRGIDRRYNELTEENFHSFGSLLLATHYGTPETLATIKRLIQREGKTKRISYKRIQLTSPLYDTHKNKLAEYLEIQK